jgi:hypothetical protein
LLAKRNWYKKQPSILAPEIAYGATGVNNEIHLAAAMLAIEISAAIHGSLTHWRSI